MSALSYPRVPRGNVRDRQQWRDSWERDLFNMALPFVRDRFCARLLRLVALLGPILLVFSCLPAMMGKLVSDDGAGNGKVFRIVLGEAGLRFQHPLPTPLSWNSSFIV